MRIDWREEWGEWKILAAGLARVFLFGVALLVLNSLFWQCARWVSGD